MNLQHVNVKFFVDGDLTVDLERFIEVFHQWATGDQVHGMMIDVADYRHVPNGPSVMLVGLEDDYSFDCRQGRYGLLYNRKGPYEGTNADRFRQALRSAEKACSILEAEIHGLKFDRSRFEVFINDRALAPNTAETRQQFAADLTAFLKDAAGEADPSPRLTEDPRQRVGALVELSGPLSLKSAPATA